MKNTTSLALIVVTALILSSCGITDHDHDHDNDHDYATTVILTLINQSNTSDSVKAIWKDLDGPGGALPSIIDTLKLKSEAMYLGKIELYNESKTPKTDITAEILEDSYEHQFFYSPSSSISDRITWTITDKDTNNLPIGLQFQINTKSGVAQSGKVNIILSHYDSMKKDGIRKSLESDIDIDIPLVFIQ